MTARSPMLVAAAILLATVTRGLAEPGHGCLSKEQERAAIAAGQVVKLAAAVQALHGPGGELISARLCHGARGLEYVLTLLARDGKVTRATIDAGNGTVLGRR